MGKIIWTKEKCQEEAFKYKERHIFKKNNGSAYNSASKNNWLDEICSHMIIKYHSPNYWTKEKCQEEALKYNKRNKFKHNSPVAYAKSIEKKWIDELCLHMPKNKIKTKEECFAIASNYNTKTELARKEVKVYRLALKKGWLDEICSHMEIKGNRFKKCIYAYEFIDNAVYVGLTYNLETRDKKHKNDKRSAVYKHIKQTNYSPIIKKLTEYVDVDNAKELEHFYVNKYKNENWIILNKMKTGSVGGNTIKWTIENCRTEALKYTTRSTFADKSKSAYYTSLKKGWLNEICSHMKQLQKPVGYWTKEKCYEEAMKYKKLEELKINNPPAHRAIYNHKWNKEIKERLGQNSPTL